MKDRLEVEFVADRLTRSAKVYYICGSLLLIIAIIVGTKIFAPHSLISYSAFTNCPNNYNDFVSFCGYHSIENGNFWKSRINELSKTSSFILFGAYPIRNLGQSSDELEFEVRYTSRLGVVKPDGSVNVIQESKDELATISCESQTEQCSSSVLIIYNNIEHDEFEAQIEFEMSDSLKQLINGFKFFAMSANPPFTVFHIVLRYVLLSISLGGLIIYACYYSANRAAMNVENKMILVLSVLLIFFNDPLFALSLLSPSVFTSIYSNICMSLFMAFLICFWLSMLRIIQGEKVRILSKENLFIGTAIFVLFFFVTFGSSYATRFSSSYRLGTKHPVLLTIMKYTSGLVCLLVFSLMAVRINTISNSWGNQAPRHKLFVLISFVFMIVLCVLMTMGLTQAFEYKALRFTVLFMITNYYVISLQLMWRTALVSLGKPSIPKFSGIEIISPMEGKDIKLGSNAPTAEDRPSTDSVEP